MRKALLTALLWLNLTAPLLAAPIKIGYSAWPGWFPWKVAEEKGLFKKNNVDVQMVWFEGYADSISALVAAKLDANCQTLNDTISPAAAGAKLKIVLTNDNSAGNDQIIVKKDISSIKDLKGKKLGAELGTVDHYLLLLGLEKAGLSAKDIQFTPIETGAAAAAFAAGRLDGVGVFAPFTTKALSTGKGKVLFSSKDFPGAISDHLVFREEFVKTHPDEVQKIVKTWFDTLDYIQKNPKEAVEIMARRAGTSIEDYKSYDSGTRIFSLAENLATFAPETKVPTNLHYQSKIIASFLVKSGLAKTRPDLNALFDARFIKAQSRTAALP
ncbi:ABC transporter substrate-binding protein [Gloeobacter kilaueensis]|uniref:Alkanesulfonate transporter substrate-binding subunit n=1 Tax=Gloeobacter kilaueensis (strain ATCC BAA-2537 / CCAP 1431/1 / ULC 316 / JS1) TaxID=1183438 RepID=U5QHS1_GLOK1|nr:ABC transporter substrate-binding protein [Gloeobacter kilaueensis]AGY58471.1 alkanesulfonate transporter substrate-binding subunit [Gloeobacter kilaueensis JS1]